MGLCYQKWRKFVVDKYKPIKSQQKSNRTFFPTTQQFQQIIVNIKESKKLEKIPQSYLRKTEKIVEHKCDIFPSLLACLTQFKRTFQRELQKKKN